MIFGGVILVVGFVTLIAVLIGMVGYLTTSEAYLILSGGQSRIFRLLRKLPFINRFFSAHPHEPKCSSGKGGRNKEDPISKLMNGYKANSDKVISNGYGPSHDHHDDSFEDDLLDSDVDGLDDEETTAPPMPSSESDIGLENGMEDDDEDLGNQQTISHIHCEDKVKLNLKAKEESPTPDFDDNIEESTSVSSPFSSTSHDQGIIMNGVNEETESENSEM